MRRFRHQKSHLGTLGLVLFLVGCAASPEERLADLAPRLPQASRIQLVHASDADLELYYASEGHDRANFDFMALSRAILMGAPEDRDFILPYMRRIAEAWEDVFGNGFGLYCADYLAGLDWPQVKMGAELGVERHRIRFDENKTPDEKIERLSEIESFCREEGRPILRVVVLYDLGQLEAEQENWEVASGHFLQALKVSESIGYAEMTCQVLGALYSLARRGGRYQDADEFLDRWTTIANRLRIANQAARAEEFRGNVALKAGRLNAAFLHYQQAREVCRRFKGHEYEIRYIDDLVNFYRQFGCWNIIAELVEESRAIPWGPGVPEDLSILRTKMDMAMAEARAGRGNLEEALALSREILEDASPIPYSQVYGSALLQNAKFLVATGRFSEAGKVIEMGIRQTAEDNLPDLERSFKLLEVENLEQAGRYREALGRLQGLRTEFDAGGDSLPLDAREEVLLEVRLTRAEYGDGPELAAAVGRALRILQIRLATGRPSAHTYLELQEFDPLRWIVHELVEDSPRLGYAFEMAWRGLTRVRDRHSVFDPRETYSDAAAVLEDFIAFRMGGRIPEPAPGDLHLVYVVTGGEILRWTRRGQAIERSTLDWDPEEMRATVGRALAGLSTRPIEGEGSVSLELQTDLSLLYDRLIPTAFGPVDGALWISADDALTRIPFATFDTDPGPEYRPLVLETDIGYLRFLGLAGGRTDGDPGGQALVVADPVPATGWAHRVPGLVPLPGAREEAGLVARKWGAEDVLVGADATKGNLMARWEDADRIFLAAHLVRDPLLPYLAMIPLAEEPKTNRLADEILEAADILPADLNRCDLAVIAACGSGAPYVAGSLVAPGLGEAFLDAGAAGLVQTLWAVDDGTSLDFMTGYLGSPDGGEGAFRRLCSSQREFIAGKGIVGHPYSWGPYEPVTTGFD